MTRYLVTYRNPKANEYNARIFNSRPAAVEFAKLYLGQLCAPYKAPLQMLIQYAEHNKIAYLKIIEDNMLLR